VALVPPFTHSLQTMKRLANPDRHVPIGVAVVGIAHQLLVKDRFFRTIYVRSL
jgi:hypothetical protein